MKDISLPPLRCFNCQQEKLAPHIGMDRAPEFMPSRPGHLESDGRVALRVQIDTAQAMALDYHPVIRARLRPLRKASSEQVQNRPVAKRD